ncbi:MAG: BMP family ABC transporter substrate-binding protein [Oscillospiraceae bacterium]|nr:BMP family ABC transporter substrate-binding protein [Oscillospiraceae bacterium]
MKKLIALLLALCMVACLFAGCTEDAEPTDAPVDDPKPTDETPVDDPKPTDEDPVEDPTDPVEDPTDPVDTPVSADDIPDAMESSDGKYEIAFVTDVGQLKDKSFNQGTYDGVKLFANANGLTYKYYQPANGDAATDDDRFEAMKAAAENGAKVVVCAGFMQGTALEQAAAAYPEVKFVFIDGWSLGMDNVAGVVFQEEQCGYLAGYAAVKDGYTKLGFTGGGGGTNDACCRYGYGYVQGANAAAAELGITVDMNYTWLYGASFSPSAELQTLCSGWYETGTEVIFSCGGSIFDSVTAAASANDCAVIGVDVDQSFSSDTVITSALKGIGEAAYQALEAAYGLNGADWSAWGNNCVTLGAAQGSVGLPTATWSLTGWTVEEYEALLAAIVDGSVVIDADFSKLGTNTPNVNLTIVE